LPDLNADTASGERHNAVMSVVAPNTFDALGMRLMRGRDFDDRDDQGAPLVAIVNETLARASLLGAGIVGHTIFCGFDSFAPMTVVGVISDVRQAGPATPPEPECYMAYLQHNYNGSTLSIVVRTAIEPMSLAETIRRKAHEVSPTVPVRFSTLENLVARNVAAPRFRALLVGLFAATGLLLAVVGVFGVMAYVVSQRTGEIGLRMALGANQRQLLALLYRRGLILTALGLTLGLCGAAVATRFMASFLFGITPTDPLTFVAAISLLAVSSLLALHVPAWRATRIDPLVAIRSE
jgi:putative ABC transport system permease protein